MAISNRFCIPTRPSIQPEHRLPYRARHNLSFAHILAWVKLYGQFAAWCAVHLNIDSRVVYSGGIGRAKVDVVYSPRSYLLRSRWIVQNYTPHLVFLGSRSYCSHCAVLRSWEATATCDLQDKPGQPKSRGMAAAPIIIHKTPNAARKATHVRINKMHRAHSLLVQRLKILTGSAMRGNGEQRFMPTK